MTTELFEARYGQVFRSPMRGMILLACVFTLGFQLLILRLQFRSHPGRMWLEDGTLYTDRGKLAAGVPAAQCEIENVLPILAKRRTQGFHLVLRHPDGRGGSTKTYVNTNWIVGGPERLRGLLDALIAAGVGGAENARGVQLQLQL